MTVKQIWNETDFEVMGWHDAHIYSITFPEDRNYDLIFDIDYLFERIINPKSGHFTYWISPCDLTFLNVYNLTFKLDFRKSTGGLDILAVDQQNPRLSPYEKFTKSDYVIQTDMGTISFVATGFVLKVREQPIFSRRPILYREKQ